MPLWRESIGSAAKDLCDAMTLRKEYDRVSGTKATAYWAEWWDVAGANLGGPQTGGLWLELSGRDVHGADASGMHARRATLDSSLPQL